MRIKNRNLPSCQTKAIPSARPVARRMQVGTTHPLRIWIHPLGIFKVSKGNIFISPLKSVIYPTTKACCLCWTIVVGNNSFSKVYVYTKYLSSVIVYNKVWNLWCWKDAFYAYAYTIYAQYMCNRALYTCINVCTKVYAAALQATTSIVFMVRLQACFLFIH
jgi:hypothetical protein